MFNDPKYRSAKYLVFADQVIVSGASFLTNIILARSLKVSGYGKFAVIILIQLFLLSVQQAVSSGIFQVMHAGVEKKSRTMYTGGLFYILIISYSIFIFIAIVMSHIFPELIREYKELFFAALLGTFLFLLQDLLRKILLTINLEARALGIDLITNALQIVFLTVFALYHRLNITSACWIICLTFIPSVMVGIIWIRPGRLTFTGMGFAFQIHKKQSPWMFMSAILQWLSGNFFVAASGFWLGTAALGALRLSQYIFGLLNVAIQAVENYVIPQAAKLQYDNSKLNHFLKTVFKKTMVALIPALLPMFLFPSVILNIIGGGSYRQYDFVLRGLAAVYVLIIAALPIRVMLRVNQLNHIYFIGYLITAAFSMLTAKWLIGHWLLTGVLTGLFLTQLIIVMFWLTILNKKNMFSWKSFISY